MIIRFNKAKYRYTRVDMKYFLANLTNIDRKKAITMIMLYGRHREPMAIEIYNALRKQYIESKEVLL